MKRVVFALVLSVMCGAAMAQQGTYLPSPTGTSSANSGAIKSKIRTWNIDERYGTADTVAITDTTITSYMDRTPPNEYSIANSWNSALGGQMQSKIFFDRTNFTGLPFSSGYDAYTVTPSNLLFFNTTTPYANLTYRTALPRYREEDYFKALLTMNVNRYVNVGGLTNLVYARGQYANQAARAVNGGFWGSYSGKRYALNAMIMFNNYRNLESGGVADPSLVEAGTMDANNIPTRLTNAASGYRNNIYYLNHKYSLGFEKERTLPNDSVVYDFVPVTSFIHTIKFDDVSRRYVDKALSDSFYTNYYYNNRLTTDSVRYYSLKNTLAVTLEEKFNRLLQFGMAAFVEHDLRHYEVLSDTVSLFKRTENHLLIGATLSKNEGKFIRYNATGQVYLIGPKIGQFDVRGNIYTDFRIAKDTVLLSAGVQFGNEVPSPLLDYFYSNNFQWENEFQNSMKLHIKGRLSLPKRNISIGFNFANLTNYIYFDKNAMPSQFDGSVQVMAFDAMVNLKAWKFHLDNQAVFQVTSSKEVLPLPDFSFYSNLYFKAVVFKVLTTQIGVSCRYHTGYYGEAYMPATGVFYQQDEVMVGNYPELNVYLNFHLKRMRFFFQYANFNFNRFGGNSYYSMPNFPLNPPTFQLGLSWNFYD